VVDEFFKQVMVMAEDHEIRKKRISLPDCISRFLKEWRIFPGWSLKKAPDTNTCLIGYKSGF
jgi:hypothetical protein